jgi:hypothetical protein
MLSAMNLASIMVAVDLPSSTETTKAPQNRKSLAYNYAGQRKLCHLFSA